MQRDNYTGDTETVAAEIRERHRDTADDVLSKASYGLLVGGEWVASEGGETATAVDATTGESLAEFTRGTAADVDRAVAAAREAFEDEWGTLSGRERGEHLETVADRLEERKEEFATMDTLEMGKPYTQAFYVDTTKMVRQFRYFAALARTVDDGEHLSTDPDRLAYTSHEPYGVVGQISAWNFPSMFVAWKLAPALAAGNTVVFKPSGRAVLSALEAADTIDEVLPDGAVNVVPGSGSTVGDAITTHGDIRKVSLTGSTTAGRAVMEGAASNFKSVSLELGGKSPNIVFPDADVENAVEGAILGIFFNQGEQCTAGSRLFLHEDVRDEFLDSFLDRTAELEIGDPLEGGTTIGPLVDHSHLEDVESYVGTASDEGAEVLAGGGRPDDPALGDAPFFEPTVLANVDDDDTVACEEVFGPVITVHEWSDRDEVVRRANATRFGLAAGLWTADLDTAHTVADEIEAGTVWVNCYNDLLDGIPHGGYKESGIGRELAAQTLEEYRRTKAVNVNFGDVPSL